MNLQLTCSRQVPFRVCEVLRLSYSVAQSFHPRRSFQLQQRSDYYSSKALHPRKKIARSSVSRNPLRYASSETHFEGSQAGVEAEIEALDQACDRIFGAESVPKEKDILTILSKAEEVAVLLLHPETRTSLPQIREGHSAASALLTIQTPEKAKTPVQPNSATQSMVDQLSSRATSLLVFPPTFITPKILESYVNLHYVLQRPEPLPTIFYLYADKPVPVEGSSPIRYSNQKKNAAANAVPLYVADRALQTAIETKQLSVAMDLVGTSYATPASRKAKFIRRALLPTTGLAAAPLAAYAIAATFSEYQSTMDPQMATNIAFIGMLSYVGFTTTIGVIAITTANDQMDRVTWATGLPLRERWLREEERSAIDKIAVAWGFRQTWKRGEEEGQDWDTLREWIGRKGMVLDRSSLLEGME